MLNILKDYKYAWRYKPFKAFKKLILNCYQRITRGWCDWDTLDGDDYLYEFLRGFIEDTLRHIEKDTSFVSVYDDEENSYKEMPIAKYSNDLRSAIYCLEAAQDPQTGNVEARELRAKAFSIINRYFDSLWW